MARQGVPEGGQHAPSIYFVPPPRRPLAWFYSRCTHCSAEQRRTLTPKTAACVLALSCLARRFYYRCTHCSAEFCMKTDPKTADYVVEAGATRNYEPWRDKEKAKVRWTSMEAALFWG